MFPERHDNRADDHEFHEIALRLLRSIQNELTITRTSVMSVTTTIQAALAQLQTDVSTLIGDQASGSVSAADAQTILAAIQAIDAQVVAAAQPVPAPAPVTQ